MIKLFLFVCVSSILFGCTDFCLHDEKDNVVIGRSMEFSVPLKSELVIHPKGEEMGKNGFSWTNKYTYIGVTAFVREIITDGMNEAGLSYGALWFPSAKYPQVDHDKKALPVEALGDWLLGNFATVKEVKEVIEAVNLIGVKIPQIDSVPPLHLSIHDRSGASLVVEFIDGKIEVSDNTVGVLTNAPYFKWHVINLANYIDLTPLNKGAINLEGTVIGPLGQGSGLLGIPGDWTPPSRFVRMSTFKNIVHKARNPKENVNLAFHLLNTVDIPYGAIRSLDGHYNYTQWTVVKDLENNILYYRDYDSLCIKKLAMPKNANKVQYFPLD
ncbi:linear amide C-N hydrolase [Candidatus Neptunochlamydia vexilliferae]|uniref:linear amide C-N hydrolase n=1 Tax=Candidatus Neptunichlamydia vexilliferae TaxID=1651774 RepID=UPI001890E946|nr:choloylglycine hydrolase family protein [Candidatus Neptunochlamydia vexilliferae]